MLDWLGGFWDFVGTNAAEMGVLLAALSAGGSLFAYFANRQSKLQNVTTVITGGCGGNATVGGNGTAIAGHGGRVGLFGAGGNGGDAIVDGDGFAIGGDGGEGGYPWRPVLGGRSTLERQIELGQSIWSGNERDEFGFFVVGRGGDGGYPIENIVVDGHEYPILPLVRLLRLWAPQLLDAADNTRPNDTQTFWENVRRIDNDMAEAVEAQIRECLKVASDGEAQPPDPYLRLNPRYY